jgi:hypothetical protein
LGLVLALEVATDLALADALARAAGLGLVRASGDCGAAAAGAASTPGWDGGDPAAGLPLAAGARDAVGDGDLDAAGDVGRRWPGLPELPLPLALGVCAVMAPAMTAANPKTAMTAITATI